MHLLSKKNIIFILTLVILLTPMFFVYAAEPYKLLVKDLPFFTGETVTPGEGGGVGRYLNNIFKLGLGIAVTLAILMFVYNGVIYMTSDIVGSVEGAKKAFYSIVGGLVLVFSSVLILGQINPDLVNFGLFDRLNDIEAPSSGGGGGGGWGGGTEPPAGGVIPHAAEEQQIRNDLPPGITGSRACAVGEVTQNGCVSFFGLQPGVLDSAAALKNDCGPTCTLRITGAKEPGHATHATGDKLDYSRNQSAGLTAYIESHEPLGSKKDSSGRPGNVYRINGSDYWDENSGGRHWHSCVGTSCGFVNLDPALPR